MGIRVEISNKGMKILYIICLVIMATFTITSLFQFVVVFPRVFYDGRSETFNEYIMVRDTSVYLMCMLVCAILVFSLAFNKPWDKQNRSLFRILFVLGLLIFLNSACSYLEYNHEYIPMLKALNSLEYINEIMIVYCYWIYVREELRLRGDNYDRFNIYCRIAILAETIAVCVNLKYGYFFQITDSAEFIYGNYNWCSEVVGLAIYIFIMTVIMKHKKLSSKEKMIMLTFMTFPFVVIIYSACTSEYIYLAPAYLLSILTIYINIFSLRSRKMIEQEALLTKQSMALMVSQIQPHFLYNVLTTISNLCVTDPEEAEETTVLFSQYLRTNLDSLRQSEPVPFAMEMQHIRTYVELEKKRFGSKLNVEYDIETDSFMVPSLGLQPIVENSIKHGIRGKDTPGHLKITSRKRDDGYEVIIEDDGVGFDPNAVRPDDGRSHVGMANVRMRLMQMCNATMDVISSPGNGCKTTIVFPK